MILEAVQSQLLATSALTSLCPNLVPTVRPLRVGPPFVVLTLDDDRRERMLDGSEGPYRQAVLSADCYATRLADAIAIADAVESALIDYSGGALGTTSPQVLVDHLRLERRGPHLFESDTDLHRVPLEFLIGYEV